jgi:hypothetical protein
MSIHDLILIQTHDSHKRQAPVSRYAYFQTPTTRAHHTERTQFPTSNKQAGTRRNVPGIAIVESTALGSGSVAAVLATPAQARRETGPRIARNCLRYKRWNVVP